MECKENTKIQIKRKRNVNEGNQKLYAILINQLSLVIRSKLEGTIGHKKVEADQDEISL